MNGNLAAPPDSKLHVFLPASCRAAGLSFSLRFESRSAGMPFVFVGAQIIAADTGNLESDVRGDPSATQSRQLI